jgi:transposase
VWAGRGRSRAALGLFFDELGERWAAEITHVSADMADWIAETVAARAPNAIRCADPFHVVAWAAEALDIEQPRAWNRAKGRKISPSPGRRGPTTGDSRQITRSRYASWKNPSDPTSRQRQQLDWIAKTDPKLWRANVIKKNSATYSQSRDKMQKRPSTVGCPGPGDHDSNRSSTSQRGSRNIAKRSKRTSSTASPKD